MTQQYWIGGFYIDLSRNQITQNDESKTLAPKALSVLTYLAEHQGKVVSQDELLGEIWKTTVVSPNTLQRCIAQLRKALGEEGKVYIKTHAKKGYSLECDVRWLNQEQIELSPVSSSIKSSSIDVPPDMSKPIEPNPAINRAANRSSLFMVLASVIVIGFIWVGVNSDWITTSSKLNMVEIRELTATDNKEVSGVYSPDGQYIVFSRYSNEYCSNHIWAKNITTQQEYRLTQSLNSNGAHHFSKDGSKLIFVQARPCNEVVVQKSCFHLMSLDFQAALASPQSPQVLLECKNSHIKSPKWLNDDDIVMLQKFTNRWKLIRYSPTSNESETIYQISDGNLSSYDYSPELDLIAMISVRNDDRYYIEMLRPTGELISSYPIQFAQHIAKFKMIYAHFSPFAERLVFSTGKQMFTLSFDGQVENISLTVDERLGSPVFHPSGQRMLAIKGQYDSDVVSTSVNKIAEDNGSNRVFEVVHRSIKGENNGLFQPQGELLAFKSARSGQTQIWTAQGSQLKQLSDFELDSYIYEFRWSSAGDKLIANVDRELVEIDLNGLTQRYVLPNPVMQMFHWDSDKQEVLANVRLSGVIKFARINLKTADISVLNESAVNWADKTASGDLVYTDHLDRFWRAAAVEDQLITALTEQGSDKRFVADGDKVFGINESFQLWAYDLATDSFAIIGPISDRIDDLSDVRNEQMLMTYRVTSRKEVAEVFLAR